MEFGTTRILGLLGALLIILSIVFSILGIIGIILVLISLYYLAQIYGERRIFTYALLWFAVSIVAAFLVLFVFVGVFSIGAAMEPEELLSTLLGAGLLSLIILYLLLILAGFFFYKSMSLLASKSNIGLFKTSGLLLFAGTITLILLVGFLLAIASWIVLAIAFYELKPPAAAPEAPSVQP